MSNHTIDNSRIVRDSRSKEIGKADYGGNVSDGGRDRGRIENNRYIDERGNDQGWVKKATNSGNGSGGELFLVIIGVLLVVGIYYLMYLGIKWLYVEGKKSLAHASRSWGITSLLFPPVFFLAITKGKAAIEEIRSNGGPSEQEAIARTGIVMGYIGGLVCVFFVGFLMAAIYNQSQLY